jgi:hypothetical protein
MPTKKVRATAHTTSYFHVAIWEGKGKKKLKKQNVSRRSAFMKWSVQVNKRKAKCWKEVCLFGVIIMLTVAQSHGRGPKRNAYRDDHQSLLKKILGRSLPPLVCRIMMETTMYSNNFGTWGEEKIVCAPIIDNQEIDTGYIIELPEAILGIHSKQIEQGELYVEVPGGRLSQDSVISYNQSNIDIVDPPDGVKRRLQTTRKVGKRTILVLRVSVKDSTPMYSAGEFYDRIFGYNDVTLQSQYDQCSGGQLLFEPAPVGKNGILEVELRTNNVADFESRSALANAAQDIAAETLRLPSDEHISSLADHIMICLPPGTGNWVAWASVNHWRSVYNNQFCGILSASMHEIG